MPVPVPHQDHRLASGSEFNGCQRLDNEGALDPGHGHGIPITVTGQRARRWSAAGPRLDQIPLTRYPTHHISTRSSSLSDTCQ
eukprot:1919030-Rhodomonas_salina.1